MLKNFFLYFITAAMIIFITGCSSDDKLPSADLKDTTLASTPAAVIYNTPVPTNAVTPTAKIIVSDIKFSKDDFRRVDGSTATIPLSEAIAEEVLNISSTEASQVINHYTTHSAYMRLLGNEVDFILVTEPSQEELKLAKEKNIELEVVPVVKDAFVFLVNTKNPVQLLTQKQIQDIYTGKVTNWKDVGGVNGEIIAYQRPVNSGSQTLMENLVMKSLKLKEAPKEITPSAMDELIEKVAGYKNSENAIGYSVYYYANTMYNKDTVKLIGIDGFKPEKSTIQQGKYPYTSAYYAVFKKSEPEDSLARRMLSWILSEKGQSIAEKAGYIPVK